jgi:hypothetical protein
MVTWKEENIVSDPICLCEVVCGGVGNYVANDLLMR